MFDLNLALIDVAIAWVVVTLPRFVQARLLHRAGLLGFGQEDRLRPDPVQQMSFVGTLAAPAVSSLLGLPVLAWGKDFDAGSYEPNRNKAYLYALVTALTYAIQGLTFAVAMVLLAKVYLAGAPVAARAGQLCLRLALVSLFGVPVMDAGIAWRFLVPSGRRYQWLQWVVSAALLAWIAFSPHFAMLNDGVTLMFFRVGQALQ